MSTFIRIGPERINTSTIESYRPLPTPPRVTIKFNAAESRVDYVKTFANVELRNDYLDFLDEELRVIVEEEDE